MKHALAALFLLAAAAPVQAMITDTFLAEESEQMFSMKLIHELKRQDIPISEKMIGGAFQWSRNTAYSDSIRRSTNTNTGEILSIVEFPMNYSTCFNWPDCPVPGECSCLWMIKTAKGEDSWRGQLLKGATFLIEDLRVRLTETGEFSHIFILSEANRTADCVKPIPGQERKAYIKCVSNRRLKQWSLIAGFEIRNISPLMSKQDKDFIARAPFPEVPKEGSGKSFGGPDSLMGQLVASPWSAWRVGVEAEGKSPELAIAKYTEGIQANPKDAWSHWKRANAYRKKKEFPSAIRDLGEVIRLAESDEDTEAFAIEMLNTRGLWRRDDIGDPSESIADFDEVIRRAKAAGGEIAARWEWSGYANRGLANRGRREYNESIRDFDKALAATDGKNARLFRERGGTYFEMKDCDSAIRDFTEAIHIDSQYAEAYYGRSACYSYKPNQSDLETALRDVNRAIELDGKDARYFINRAIILERLGRTSEAAADRRKAKELE